MFFHPFQNEDFSFWNRRAVCHLLEKFSVSFAFEFWIHSEPLSPPDALHRSQEAAWPGKALMTGVCWHVELCKGSKYLCLLYSHEWVSGLLCHKLSTVVQE